MTLGAADPSENCAPRKRGCAWRKRWRRSEKAHEVRGTVHFALAGDGIHSGFRVCHFVKLGEDIRLAVRGVFLGKQAVGDPHFVEECVSRKREKGGLLGFPTEPANRVLAACNVHNPRGFPSDPVDARSGFILQQGGFRNGFDEAGADQWAQFFHGGGEWGACVQNGGSKVRRWTGTKFPEPGGNLSVGEGCLACIGRLNRRRVKHLCRPST